MGRSEDAAKAAPLSHSGPALIREMDGADHTAPPENETVRLRQIA